MLYIFFQQTENSQFFFTSYQLRKITASSVWSKIYNMLFFNLIPASEPVPWQQAVPDVPPLQPAEGDDQGGDAPSRLHGAQARVEVQY